MSCIKYMYNGERLIIYFQLSYSNDEGTRKISTVTAQKAKMAATFDLPLLADLLREAEE